LDTFDRIEALLKQRGISAYKLSKDTGISTGLISQWKNRAQKPSAIKLQKVANYFGVTVGYLLGTEPKEKAPTLTEKDERDISKKMQETLAQLEAQQSGLMFDGEPLDDETKELLAISLKNSLELAKKIAKQKYTPKKYRKKSE